jgi:riboflavin synthase
MFTGIIETVGIVRQVQPRAGGLRIGVDLGGLHEGLKAGESIAVSGVCLTVCEPASRPALFDISRETLSRSTLGKLHVGSRVNLERAMAAGGRFGGHFVQGHIDGIGRIASIRKQGDFAEFRIEAPKELLEQMVEKGSVALDGISLTTASLDTTGFTVALIPTTLRDTTWKEARVGDAVNIETDILIKTVLSRLGPLTERTGASGIDALRQMGY